MIPTIALPLTAASAAGQTRVPSVCGMTEGRYLSRFMPALLRHDPARERLRDWNRDTVCPRAETERFQQHLHRHPMREMRPDQLPGVAAQVPIGSIIQWLIGMARSVQVFQRDTAVPAIDHPEPVKERAEYGTRACGFDLLVPAKIPIKVLVVPDFVVGDPACNGREPRIAADAAQGRVVAGGARLDDSARRHLAGARRLQHVGGAIG